MTAQIQSLIDHGRTVAAELMIDNGVITRPSEGPPVLNRTTGVSVPAASTFVYDGPCRVRAPGIEERTALFGDDDVTVQRFVVSFPPDIPEVRVGDNVAVASDGDTLLVARPFRVVAVEKKSVLHSRRLGVEAVE